MTAHFTSFADAQNAGIEYMLAVGRRQPMHVGHLETIHKIMANGITPIVVIASSNSAFKPNGFADPLFEPVSNPLTAAQQHEQLRRALPDKTEGTDYLVVEFPDLGDNDLWCRRLVEILKGEIEINGGYPDISGKTGFHFIGKPKDKRPRRLVMQDGQESEVLAYFWEGILDALGLPVLEDTKHTHIPLELSATQLRGIDLGNLSPGEQSPLAVPEYIVALAQDARRNSPVRDRLEHIPVSLFDLTLHRLAVEKHIDPAVIIENAAQRDGGVSLPNLLEATREVNRSMTRQNTVQLKIASASLNQTVYDLATNLPNIFTAIDRAVEDGADILSLEELGLTGYAADDYHQWFKSNDQLWPAIEKIAQYANAQNPDLVVSLGTPWHYEDKTLLARDPLYNINNRPYNTQMTITGGKVVALSAKSILADGPAEYEPHQFVAWPDDRRTQTVQLPDGRFVPMGKPVISLENTDGKRITLFTEQCAEAWPGVGDDTHIITREQQQARYLVALAGSHDLSVVLNPSASKPQPAIDKEGLRSVGLCEAGSKYCGVYVYTNYLGSNSGTTAAEGSQIFAQDGKTIHHGQRYAFSDVSYSSAVFDVPLAERGAPHAVASHEFHSHPRGQTVGSESAFEALPPDAKMIEEYARSISLWLRDYLAKQVWPCQGYLISLSGGKDSAYGAVAVSTMVDLEVQENGIEGFFKRFNHMKWENGVRAIYSEHGEEAAVDAIKSNLLTCIYLPSDNSSKRTEHAARFLIEGGMLEDGRNVKGIGGSFSVHNVQQIVNQIILSASGFDGGPLALSNPEIVLQYVKGTISELHPRLLAEASQHIPTYNNPADDITLQNVQARARLPLPWTIANMQGKMALVTSNESEAVLGYTTAGGDMHMGGANPIGGMPKDDITRSLAYLEHTGLSGLPPVEALYYVTREKPSAELRPEKEGVQQTDESDLGFSYAQAKVMENLLIEQRNRPQDVFATLQSDPLFPDASAATRDIIARFCRKWESAQFKRVMSTLAPYVGDNVDPHQSVRTTVLGDHFQTGMALLTLDVMKEIMGGALSFRRHTGLKFDEAQDAAMFCTHFKKALLGPSVEALGTPEGIAMLQTELEKDAVVLEKLRAAAGPMASRVNTTFTRNRGIV